MSTTRSKVLTPHEVAEVFAVNAKTVTRWAERGILPHFRTLGGHRRFYADDVDAARQALLSEEASS